MKTNLMFGLVTCAVAERVEFLWNDKDVNGPRGVIQDWIWTKSEESLRTMEGSSRRLGCSLSSLETGMAHQHRPHQDRLTRTAPTSTAPTPPAPPPSLKKALSSYIDDSAGKSEERQSTRVHKFDAAAHIAGVIWPNHPRVKEKSDFFSVLMKTANVGFTPLHLAVVASDKDMVNTIVRGGADITAATAYGLTPLHLAVMIKTNQEIVGLLVRHGADILTKDGFGLTVLDLALKCEQETERGKWVNVRAMWEALHGKLEELGKGAHHLKAQLKSAFVGNIIPDIVLGYLRPAQKDFENKIKALEDLRKPLEDSRKIKALGELRWYFTTLQKESI